MADKRKPTLKKIKGILFDFDGTLTLPGALDFSAIKREIGCPSDLAVLEFFETLPPEIKRPLMEILERKEDKAAEESEPNVGAEACLCDLKQKGLLLGILTRNSLRSIQKAFRKFSTVSPAFFAAIITRDDSLPKPHPDGVHQAAKRMGILSQELMVVGDFRFDIMAGRRAGARTVLLTNRRESVMAPGDPRPDFIILGLEEIPGIIDAIEGDERSIESKG
jgi:hydrogenase expression/formation protein HypE